MKMKGIFFVFHLIMNDFSRYIFDSDNLLVVFAKFFHNPGMLFSVLYRIQRYLMYQTENVIFRFIGYLTYPMYFFITYYVLDYHIEPRVKIGGGLFLHNRSIVITDLTEIGKNFSIMGQTTIGTGFDKSGNIRIVLYNTR